MLQNLHVKNLALIKEVDVYFGEGLNILTGETGAGKSILIDSLNIALGGKVSKEMIREDAQYAAVELVFSLGDQERSLLRQYGINEQGEEQLLISRKIVSGRSTIKINGETVTMTTLKDITSTLIDIHGQHEHQSLLYKSKHLSILDQYAFSKASTLLEDVKTEYSKYTSLQKELESFSLDEGGRSRERAFLEFAIKEIEDAQLKIGEDEQLEQEYRKMSNSRKIIEGITSVYNLLSYENSQGAGDIISRASKGLSNLVEYDDTISDFYSQILDLDSICGDLSRELADYISDVSYNEENLSNIEERLDLINKLKSKYGKTIEEIEQYYIEKEKELHKLNNYDIRRDTIKKELDSVYECLYKKSEELSKIRKQASIELQQSIIASLQELNFLNVMFEIDFRKKDRPTSTGLDDVEFMISTNPGEPVRPLSKVASGGELSRIMLAIKTILANADEVNTLIFDEIDTGISGRTAQMVSEKLALIGNECQVICITHLPQIASMADQHFLIEKNVIDGSTLTSIVAMNQEESVEELARMLGGVSITQAVLDNAREMKELAKQTKISQS